MQNEAVYAEFCKKFVEAYFGDSQGCPKLVNLSSKAKLSGVHQGLLTLSVRIARECGRKQIPIVDSRRAEMEVPYCVLCAVSISQPVLYEALSPSSTHLEPSPQEDEQRLRKKAQKGKKDKRGGADTQKPGTTTVLGMILDWADLEKFIDRFSKICPYVVKEFEVKPPPKESVPSEVCGKKTMHQKATAAVKLQQNITCDERIVPPPSVATATVGPQISEPKANNFLIHAEELRLLEEASQEGSEARSEVRQKTFNMKDLVSMVRPAGSRDLCPGEGCNLAAPAEIEVVRLDRKLCGTSRKKSQMPDDDGECDREQSEYSEENDMERAILWRDCSKLSLAATCVVRAACSSSTSVGEILELAGIYCEVCKKVSAPLRQVFVRPPPVTNVNPALPSSATEPPPVLRNKRSRSGEACAVVNLRTSELDTIPPSQRSDEAFHLIKCIQRLLHEQSATAHHKLVPRDHLLFFCAKCERFFHQSCLSPPRRDIVGPFVCSDCLIAPLEADARNSQWGIAIADSSWELSVL